MARRKPGPNAQRRNPSPRPDEEIEIEGQWVPVRNAEASASVAVEQMDAAERALRQDLKTRRRELNGQREETVHAAVQRIAALIRDVAEENYDEHLWWTGRRREDTEEIPVDRLYPLTREPDGTWTLRYVGPGSEPGGPRQGWERHYRIMPYPRQRKDASALIPRAPTLDGGRRRARTPLDLHKQGGRRDEGASARRRNRHE